MNHIIKLYEKITEQGYITQTEYLSQCGETVTHEDAMLELYAMEEQGLIFSNAGAIPVYYLIGTIIQ